MLDEKPFQEMIAANPGREEPSLVFADFLEENGECGRARNIRDRFAHLREVSLSEEQLSAVLQVEALICSREYVTLGGYAGCGKTTVIRHLTRRWGDVAVAALCGKAVNVLRCKGVEQAQTIHSLIYEPIPETNPVQFRRRDELKTKDDARVSRLIIDEASMISEQMLADLLSFEVPILFVGDHGQLEPIGRESWLMHTTDVTLTTIHRQAQNNPILRLATALREGRSVPYWQDKWHRLQIVPKDRFWDLLNPGMTAICGYNKTRHRVNAECRKKLGFDKPHPVPGDRLVCLKNNGNHEIFNGQMAVCVEVQDAEEPVMTLKVRLDDDRLIEVPARRDQFGKETDPYHYHWSQITLWDYGYCLTAHKSQGSEMDDVIVLEQYSPMWNMSRWGYTAATRARESLIYCR